MITLFLRNNNDTTTYEASINSYIHEIKAYASNIHSIPLDRLKLEITKPKDNEKVPLIDDRQLVHYRDYIKNNTLSIMCEDEAENDKFVFGVFLAYLFPIISYVIFMVLNIHRINSYYLLVTAMAVFHYSKRELENKFIHIYSKESKHKWPAAGVILHYWFVCGLCIPFEIYALRDMHNTYSSLATTTIVIGFLTAEILNFYCHYELRLLRFEVVQSHTRLVREHKIPKGIFFDQMIAPNYTFESLAWVFFAIFCRSISGVIFLVLSTIAMYNQAKNRKERLLSSKQVSTTDKSNISKRGVYFPSVLFMR